MPKKFYPESAGKTKDDVINDIEDRVKSGYPACYVQLSEANLSLLTDERMQKFVNDWQNAMENNIEFGDDAVGSGTEKVLWELAKVICNSPDVEFDL